MEINWNQKRPSEKQKKKIKKKISNSFFKSVKIKENKNITTFQNIININNVNGGMKILSFKFEENEKLDWFLSRNRYSEIDFFESFFKSEEFKIMSSDFSIKEGKEKQIAVNQFSSLKLDGELASYMVSGGAYREFTDRRMAKSISTGVCNEIFRNRYEDVTIFSPQLSDGGKELKGLHELSNWFKYIDVWSHCLTILDKGMRVIHIIVITDED